MQSARMKSRNTTYKPPFVYFGGKSPVAQVVWDALGADVANYVEPFAGSAAVLFLRPQVGNIETINDADGFVSNVWRSIKADSDEVARWADELVSEAELHARHLWLLGQRERLTERLMGDPDFYDAKAAGFWIWGINCWIGSGWCSGNGPWVAEGGVLTLRNPCQGACAERLEWLKGYLAWFADRLRGVRVCCGDWSRVCGPSVTFKHGLTGVFLDPPYPDTAGRAERLYAVDCEQVAHDACAWAIEQSANPLMRIVLCGYEGSHVMPEDWRVLEWKAAGGYGLEGDEDSRGRVNRKRERLWFSPHCISPKERRLF
jgi:DNA adenine methylase